MKLPRWLLWSMVSLSVVAVLGAAGWWWVTWPERTARAYISSLPTVANNHVLSTRVAEILRRFEGYIEPGTLIYRGVPPYTMAEQRSLLDVLVGRQTFSWEVKYGEETCNEFVVAERGLIVDMGVIFDRRYSVLDEL